MSQHLSSQQILDWMNGEFSQEASRHVRNCEQCSGEVERLTSALGMFRSAVRDTAEQLGERQYVFEMPRRSFSLRWVAAAAALLLLAGLPIYRVKLEQERQLAAQIAREDAELMSQVEAELSAGVAGPMKPLQKMVSWTGESKSGPETRQF
jgi:ribosomal protein S14